MNQKNSIPGSLNNADQWTVLLLYLTCLAASLSLDFWIFSSSGTSGLFRAYQEQIR